MAHYQTGANSCVCGQLWPCAGALAHAIVDLEISRCELSDGCQLVATIRGATRKSSRVIFAVHRIVNGGAIETTEITEAEAQILLAMRANQ